MKTARRWPSTNQGAGPRWEPNLPPPWSQTFSLPAVSGLSQQTMLKAKIIQEAATWFSNGEVMVLLGGGNQHGGGRMTLNF